MSPLLPYCHFCSLPSQWIYSYSEWSHLLKTFSRQCPHENCSSRRVRLSVWIIRWMLKIFHNAKIQGESESWLWGSRPGSFHVLGCLRWKLKIIREICWNVATGSRFKALVAIEGGPKFLQCDYCYDLWPATFLLRYSTTIHQTFMVIFWHRLRLAFYQNWHIISTRS